MFCFFSFFYYVLCFFFFFFQAEDGIRDVAVTGVQTCALPILLAPGPSKTLGATEAGTVFQYRRLLELGWPADQRPFRLADRLLFRLLSRDEDPTLLIEFQGPTKTDPGLGAWARSMGRQAASAALARVGVHSEDPRLRGAAHRIASDISQYLRSELA